MLHETRHATPSCVYLRATASISRGTCLQSSIVSYQPDSLEPENAFSEKESARLREIVDSGDGVYPKAKVSKLLIDLSWASSRLEGNTYTYLDTQTLIEYGQRN